MKRTLAWLAAIVALLALAAYDLVPSVAPAETPLVGVGATPTTAIVLAEALPTVPAVTSTPFVMEIVLTSSPTLTPTPEPFVVAVDPQLYNAHRDLWPAVQQAVPNVQFTVDDMDGTPARLMMTWDVEPEDVVFASEPYMWVCRHDADLWDATWDELANLHSNGWLLLAPSGCQDMLSGQLPDGAVRSTDSADEAMALAARNGRTVALVPWSVVGAQVRALSWQSTWLDPNAPGNWPIQRRILLRGASPPDGLVEGLRALALKSPAVVDLVGVGDIMLARNVGKRITSEGVRYPYEGTGIADLLRQADVTFGNLECVVSAGGVRQSKSYTFRADPASLDGLAWAGFDVVSLANNHTCDYGRDAVIDTVRNVEQAGMLAAGAGKDLEAARQAQLLDVDGLCLAFLAYNQIGPRWIDATADRAGSAYMDPNAMVEDVRHATEHANLVIVSCHWGVENASYTTPFQRDLTARLWDAGACLVLGHHPHVMQAITVDGRRAAVYSMGNFVFDMGTPGSRDGYAVRCQLDETGVKQIELVPYHIDGYRPILLEGAARENAIDHVHRLTAQAGGWPK